MAVEDDRVRLDGWDEIVRFRVGALRGPFHVLEKGRGVRQQCRVDEPLNERPGNGVVGQQIGDGGGIGHLAEERAFVVGEHRGRDDVDERQA